MGKLEEIFKKIDPDDLNKEFCYSCLALNVSIPDSLHDSSDMKEGPITSTKKCPHCYDTENDGSRKRLKLTPEERTYASRVMKAFEAYKERVLNSSVT